eukprot:GDKJ01024293.1.p1 GENE.GDKJ01024293.1~~GDKJ01024293.1.p1  ORF type:complete len:220 (-),score=31.56 GDKJ01024293.1:13-672(-)
MIRWLLPIFLLFLEIQGKGFDDMDNAVDAGYKTMDVIALASNEMDDDRAMASRKEDIKNMQVMAAKASLAERERAQNPGIEEETSCIPKSVIKKIRDYSGNCPVNWTPTSYDPHVCTSSSYDPADVGGRSGCVTIQAFNGWSDDQKKEWEAKCCQFWPEAKNEENKTDNKKKAVNRNMRGVVSELYKFSLTHGSVNPSTGVATLPRSVKANKPVNKHSF